MPALVLSAGLGTRLRPLTESLPKALVPIGDRPALAHVLARVAATTDAKEPIVVNAHHEAGAIDRFAHSSPIRFATSHEPDLLGTGGAIAHAAAALGAGELVVWNGDIWTELAPDVLRPLAGEIAAALVVERVEGGEGNVGVAADGSIVRLRRITARTDVAEAWSANFLGIHRLSAALRSRAPVKGCAIADLYLPAISAGFRLEARVTGAPWIDVGSPKRYLDANVAWLGARDSYVAPGAIVSSNAQMVRTVVGAGARVTGAGTLDHVVVWPGAHAVAPLVNAVVMPEQIVRIT